MREVLGDLWYFRTRLIHGGGCGIRPNVDGLKMVDLRASISSCKILAKLGRLSSI